MPTHDLNGKPYVKLSELNQGDSVWIDGGFPCMRPSQLYTVKDHLGELYIECAAGMHFLFDQANDGKHCVGIYPTDPGPMDWEYTENDLVQYGD